MAKVLILTQGKSIRHTLHSMMDYEHDKNYFICSNDSVKCMKKVIEEANLDKDKYEYIITDDEFDILECFIISYNLIKKLLSENNELRIDYTGGTKPMASGLLSAAFLNNNKNIEYAYVKKIKDDVTKEFCSQVSNKQFNPFDYYAIHEFEQGRQFFNKFQYDAALFCFENAEKKLGKITSKDKKNRIKLARLYQKMAIFYKRWDEFNKKIDGKTLEEYLREDILDFIHSDEFLLNHFENDQNQFYDVIKNNLEFLSNLYKKSDEKPFLNIYYYLPDLLNNVSRRIEEGKYDDSLARLYRITELIAQLCFLKEGVIYSLDLKKDNSFYFDTSKFCKKYNKGIIREVKKYKPNFENDFKFKLNKHMMFEILRKIDNYEELAEFYLNKIKKQNEKRNTSILAHGLNPISKEDVEDLYENVLEMSKEFSKFYMKDKDLGNFPKFKVNNEIFES